MKTRPVLATTLVACAAAVAIVTGSATAQPDTSRSANLRAAFDRADADKNGVIDVDEIVGDAILVFAAYDKNRDGFLVIEELPRHDPARFKRADRDGDGKLSLSEVASDKVWEFFEADTNRDGVLSFEEVTAYANRPRQ